MANKKFTERNTRKIVRLGNSSLGITLPIELLYALGWRDNQKVIVKKIGNKLIVSDWTTIPSRQKTAKSKHKRKKK